MDYICTKCSYIGVRKKVNSGNWLYSLLWWFIVPTIWSLIPGNSSMKFTLDPVEALQEFQNVSANGIVKDIIISVVPGIIYSIWRRVKKTYACPMCEERVMLPAQNQRSGFASDSEKGFDKESHVVELERKLLQLEQELAKKKPQIAETQQAPENLLVNNSSENAPQQANLQNEVGATEKNSAKENQTEQVVVNPRKIDVNQW